MLVFSQPLGHAVPIPSAAAVVLIAPLSAIHRIKTKAASRGLAKTVQRCVSIIKSVCYSSERAEHIAISHASFGWATQPRTHAARRTYNDLNHRIVPNAWARKGAIVDKKSSLLVMLHAWCFPQLQ
jgi:hypothetical protein